ncbi:hypothetical protein V8G54_034796 [Vigna mungo]|uniref:Transposase MuDR plant domain-containing protein n=1 Tax=Vigna mungo TaxID=3915 RepID=A0AAQ3MDV4_VIGMU
MEENFEVVFHCGGKFVNVGKLNYEGESTTFSFDPDMWSYFLVVSVVKGLGYDEFKELWYSVGGGYVLENRLEPLLDDVGAMQMITLVRLNREVHLFVVHKVSEHEAIHMLEYVPQNIVEEQGEGMVEGECEEQEQGGGVVEGECEEQGEGMVEGEREEEGGGMVEGECKEQGERGECDKMTETIVVSEERVEADDVVEGEIETQVGVGEVEEDVGDVRSWTSSGDDNGNDEVNYDCMEGLIDVNVECDLEEDVGDGVADWFGNMSNDIDDGINSDHDRGFFDDEWKSDELDSGAESDGQDDEEKGYGKFVTFSMPKTMIDYKWDVGTYFADKQDFMDAIKTYSVENGRNIKYVKNDKKRIRLKYMGAKGECPWMTYCAYMEVIHTWQLRTIVDNHRCSREHKLRLLNAKWFSKRLEKTARENPQVKGVEIREKISRKRNVGVSRCMANRAKVIALDHVDGSFKDQYRRIYDYANELLARNPGSTMKVKVEETMDEHIFRRPIIGLNGAFLKGKYGGEMLIVVGRDANDQMLPLAYVVVEVENKDTWRWFLALLELLQVVHEVVPGVDQCFCVRHLYANFRKKFPGKQLKRLMWKAATTTHPQTWEAEKRNIKQLNAEAFKYLLKIPPRYWSRLRFNSKPQCDIVVNMSEAFNSVMVHTRSKPIVSMLKEIRLHLMKRWATNMTKSQSLSGEICPKIKTRLNKESQKWEITGIPRCHSLAAMKFLNLDAKDFIPCCFRKSTYKEIYSSIVYPINGNNMWEITTYVDNVAWETKEEVKVGAMGVGQGRQKNEEWWFKKKMWHL